MLPGLYSDCTIWEKVIYKLRSHFKIYAFSLPLYGTYDNKHHQYTFYTLPRLLEQLLQRFKIKSPILMGHSIGAVVSMIYAVRSHHKVDRLICVSAPLKKHVLKVPLSWEIAVQFALTSKRNRDIVDWLNKQDELVDRLRNIVLPHKKTKHEAKDVLPKLPLKNMAHCYFDLFHFEFDDEIALVAKSKLPSLFIYGINDIPLQEFQGTSLYTKVSGAEIVPLATGHYIPLTMPEELSRAVLNFAHDIY